MRIIVVSAPIAESELAADALWQLGARGVEERVVSDAAELRAAMGDEAVVVERVRAALASRWAVRVEEVDPAGADTWRDFAEPVRVSDDLVVVPAWLARPAEIGGAVLGGDTVIVSIEPGAAFGLGDHPTTRLTLAAMWRLIRPGDSVLDVGCGTGVLSVAAAMRSGRVVRGIDVADVAVAATRDNAARNGVDNLVVADTTPLAALDGSYDVVVANVLAPVLVELASDLIRVTAPGGRLVISGILADRYDHVLSALAPLRAERTDVLAGWAAVTLAR